MKSVALFDFDNTLYDGFSYFALLEKQVHENIITKKVLNKANQAMANYKNGAIDYETTITTLLNIYAAGLKGASYSKVYESALGFYTHTDKIYPYTKQVFDLLRPTHDLCLVTGEPQFIAKAIQQLYKLDNYCATQYEVVDGVFTGNVTTYLASRHEKHQAVKHLLQGHRVKNSLAFGDSEGDIEMLAAAQHPICVNATPGLKKRAAEHGWPCVLPSEVIPTLKSLGF
jgi:HAD superfamily hydrolase (TIGR01490 family)